MARARTGARLLLFLCTIGYTCAQNFYVVAPSILRLNADETLAVAVEGSNGVIVHINIQDYPGKIKNVSQTVLPVQPGSPEVFKVRLSPSDFPPNFLAAPGSQKLVSITAWTDSFSKEILVPISSQSGFVFIQTDKPIYTPKQIMHFRIISLNEEGLASEDPLHLQIKNPDGITVEEVHLNQASRLRKSGMLAHNYRFPTYPVLGEWSAIVKYGPEWKQNSTVHFELQEYVLPTFTVELVTPDVILPNAATIDANVKAVHVYGKKVQGLVTFRLGVKGDHSPSAIFFAVVGPKELDDGEYNLRVSTEELKKHKDLGWFPEIEGSRLVVEASVLDEATGNKEVQTDSKTRFSTSPLEISFKNCLKDFRPGLVSVFEAEILYVGGEPANGISTKIQALADGKPINILQNEVVSDDSGKVAFTIHPEITHSTISITLETNSPKYEGSQATGTFVQRKYESPNKAYVALERTTGGKLKPGDIFSKLLHFEPAGIKDIYYVVMAKGKLLAMNKLPAGEFQNQVIEFQVTYDMVPSFRIIAFAHYKDELLADSLRIDVERICDPNAQTSLETDFKLKEPGSEGKFVIRGTKGTMVGLLGVDEAVYALSKKDLLTKNRVFDKLSSHDTGCGPGGGISVHSVLGNAGLIVGTNQFTPSYVNSCGEIKRKKREAASDVVSRYSGLAKQCCALGVEQDKFGRSCEDRTNIVVRQLESKYHNCSKAFLECCLHAREHGISDMKLMRVATFQGRSRMGESLDNPEFIPTEEEDFYEGQLTVRRDFRETWIFSNIMIGPDNKEEKRFSLPHSITTWVVQMVSLSRKNGICIAEPQKIVSFKKIFMHLNLPYSVVRNEQVEIQATVFNYIDKRIAAIVYMYGAKDLCTGTQAGEKSERKRLVVEGQSAASVSFPVIPLKAEDYRIKVVVLSSEGSDVVEKILHVVPEGVTKEIDIPIKLDPTNQQRRAKRSINSTHYSDAIDPSQKLQVTAVKLNVPEGFVPGTASCSITALGDQFGPVVETSINNPDGLLQKPRGCGEQNIMFFAPTLYTMRYLKVTGKLTAEMEQKGFEFIRHGYGNQLAFRKEDGSYAAYQSTPTSTWLSAFVMKVFCQANELVYIDEKVLCSGVKWLIRNQEPDGSYVEKHPVYHVDMMGGVQGKVPMTAFALIALEECKCDEENLLLAKKRALAYLEDHMGEVNTPLPLAIMAYAMTLSDSELKQGANDRLISQAQTDPETNTMHWETPNAAQDIETAGYALLTQILFGDMGKSASIVNWLNTKQLQSGSFKSTQDTVVALQGLSEYAIRAQLPSINLVSNISSSNDRNFHRVLSFNKDNALVLQDVKVDKIGGTLFINTAGHGMGSMAVKLRYNLIVPPEDICKFDVTVNLTEAKEEENVEAPEMIHPLFGNPASKDMFERFPPDLIRGVKKALDEEVPAFEIDPRNRGVMKSSLISRNHAKVRNRRENKIENSKSKYKLEICVRYLGNKDAEMSIVDVGVFSGFEPIVEDLKQLQNDPSHLIQRYEKSSKGVVFYLQKVPVENNYCFAFHLVREYLVGNTQMSAVKVYDYYNPDATCTKFYSPATNSPMLRTICDGGVCECAEGGCAKSSYADILQMDRSTVTDMDTSDRRDRLEIVACENYDYVWRGELNGQVKKDGGFLNISFVVDDVIKEGIEKRNMLEGEARILLARDNCPLLFPGTKYLLMGKDGQKYKNSAGETWHRYMLDQTSVVHMWTKIRVAADKDLQKDLNYVTKTLLERGCMQ